MSTRPTTHAEAAVLAAPAAAIYRIDVFTVPEQARATFLERAGATQALLRKQPGLIGEQAFERHGGPGRFNFVTVAVWADQAAIDQAAKEVAAMHVATAFDRQAFIAANGITAEIATFKSLEL